VETWVAVAADFEKHKVCADLDLMGADLNRVVRMPGQWEFDRIAARRHEMYGPITEAAVGP
jgi:hypothetical protein